ncbi:hypothetical protein N801_01915 [Knoellia aerolata DSM 18566]|uniref:Uncharacterized protein n=1 Tax=Knoellia aerolata DSM 18566 TaxID=1385519 RepID=A0A0A0JGU5_9MICO|nr:hypothetical protein N801_01915 [Knoellia aerolata DSM 18566]
MAIAAALCLVTLAIVRTLISPSIKVSGPVARVRNPVFDYLVPLSHIDRLEWGWLEFARMIAKSRSLTLASIERTLSGNGLEEMALLNMAVEHAKAQPVDGEPRRIDRRLRFWDWPTAAWLVGWILFFLSWTLDLR